MISGNVLAESVDGELQVMHRLAWTLVVCAWRRAAQLLLKVIVIFEFSTLTKMIFFSFFSLLHLP
jgi:hypothetical protein